MPIAMTWSLDQRHVVAIDVTMEYALLKVKDAMEKSHVQI